MALDEMIPKNKPFTFEGLDIRPSFRANDAGAHTYSVNIMVTEEQWNALKTIPRHRMIGGVLYWYEDAAELPTEPEVPKKAKKEKGPHGQFWKQMFAGGLESRFDLMEVLDCDSDRIKERLYQEFEITSMAQLEPGRWIDWCTSKGLHSLISLSRQAQAKLVA